MSNRHDEREDPTAQVTMFICACVILAFAKIPALLPDRLDERSVRTGSVAVVEDCVAEKGPWNCLKTFGDVVDGQKSDPRFKADMGLIDAFPSAVPISRLLADCGRTPECIIYMASHGYRPEAIARELAQ